MTGRHIHALLHGIFYRSLFLIFGAKQELSSFGVLPSGCATLYYMFEAELFLQPQLVPHREHKNRNCFFGHIMNLIQNCGHPHQRCVTFNKTATTQPTANSRNVESIIHACNPVSDNLQCSTES